MLTQEQNQGINPLPYTRRTGVERFKNLIHPKISSASHNGEVEEARKM